MKHVFFAIALLTPGLALAYPNPNITATLSAGELVDSVWTQPQPGSIVLADNSLLPTVGK